jgi:hypothetical protein
MVTVTFSLADSSTQDNTEESEDAAKCQCQTHCGGFNKGHKLE